MYLFYVCCIHFPLQTLKHLPITSSRCLYVWLVRWTWKVPVCRCVTWNCTTLWKPYLNHQLGTQRAAMFPTKTHMSLRKNNDSYSNFFSQKLWYNCPYHNTACTRITQNYSLWWYFNFNCNWSYGHKIELEILFFKCQSFLPEVHEYSK